MTAAEFMESMRRTEHTRIFLTHPNPMDMCATEVGALKAESRFVHAVIGAGSEVGELLDAIKKQIIYGKTPDRVNRLEEWGDVLWYVALGLDADGFTFEQAFDANAAKLRARYPEQFSGEQALNRDTANEREVLERYILAEKIGSFNQPATDLQSIESVYGDGTQRGDVVKSYGLVQTFEQVKSRCEVAKDVPCYFSAEGYCIHCGELEA